MIDNLFPTPIGYYKLDRDFTSAELDVLMNQDTRHNTGNATSVDSYILKNSKLKKLRQFFDESVNDFFNVVHRPKFTVVPKITQSWINYTKPGEYHHIHRHPNSFISGVFYIQTDNEKDRIYFYKDKLHNTLEVPVADYNQWNSESWWFPAETKTLVLFPSWLQHSVNMVEAAQTRVSLSFNTFLYGQLGSEQDLTELITKE